MHFTASHRKLLVVDDEPLVRQTLDFCLRDDYEIQSVASGEEAIAAVKKEPFPVVILDLCMEGLSGLETLKKLKEVRQEQNVIILTAYQTSENAVSALNLGAFCYLTKPFEQVRLREAVVRGFDSFDQKVIREREIKERLHQIHDSFFSLLCHEFNTPMNIVLGFSELLAASVTDQEQSAWIEEIRKSGTRLHGILMEILDYTAASHNALSGRKSTFCPKELMDQLAAQVADRNIQLVVSDAGSSSRHVTGPLDSVTLIARKLIDVAAHNNTKRVCINVWVGAFGAEGKGVLRMEVTGTGLSPSQVDRESLFEPYREPGHDSSEQRISISLELATSRKIAEFSGGTLDAFLDENGEFGLLAMIPVNM